MSHPHVNHYVQIQPPPVYRNQRNFISPNTQQQPQQPIVRPHNSINMPIRPAPQPPNQNYEIKTRAKFQ